MKKRLVAAILGLSLLTTGFYSASSQQEANAATYYNCKYSGVPSFWWMGIPKDRAMSLARFNLWACWPWQPR